jgi:ribosomal protein S12 methylthiotransferase
VDRDRLRITPKHFAYVRVAEGCNHTCAFCIIPKIKGPFRSKPMEELEREVRELASDGAREIILIGQDTTEYGLDIYRKLVLDELIERISQIEGVRWIRLLYCYPTMMTDRLVQTMARNPKVVKYIDIPFQHTRERMLRLMRRGITEQRQRELIAQLRQEVPGIFIRTTAIVGFPGETEDDFEGLLADLREFRFERLGAFIYSPEPGTAAIAMEGQVPEPEKRRRFDAAMQLQQKIAFEILEAQIGRELEVIVDRAGWGRTYADAPDVDGMIELRGRAAPGDIVRCRVTGTKEYDLMGDVCDARQ